MTQGKKETSSTRHGSPASTKTTSTPANCQTCAAVRRLFGISSRTPAARRGGVRIGRFDLGTVREQIIPLIEFAWASGLVDWTPEQYEKAMIWMFPKTFEADPVIERAKYAFDLNEKRAEIMSRAGDTRKPSRK